MRIETLLKRLKREYWKIKILQSTLDSLILVLGVNFLLYIFGVTYDLRILIGVGLATFIADLVYRTRGYSVEIFEEKNSELQELLRTARDNLDRSDEASQALFNEIMDKARKMSSESIIPSTRVVQKLVLVGALSILTAISGLVVPSFSIDTSGISDQLPEFDGIGDGEDSNNTSYKGDPDSVLGDKSDLDDISSEIDLNIEGEGESFSEGVLKGFEPEEEELQYEASPELSGDEELMRRYSLAIREIE